MTFQRTQQLTELVQKKYDCLVQLRDLGRHQLVLAEQGDMVKLFKILSAKGHVIATLQSIEKALEPFRREDPDSRNWPSEEQRSRCAQQATLCQQLLAEIGAQEKQSEGRLLMRRDEAAVKLQGAHTAATARNAYQSIPTPKSGLLDLTSESGVS